LKGIGSPTGEADIALPAINANSNIDTTSTVPDFNH